EIAARSFEPGHRVLHELRGRPALQPTLDDLGDHVPAIEVFQRRIEAIVPLMDGRARLAVLRADHRRDADLETATDRQLPLKVSRQAGQLARRALIVGREPLVEAVALGDRQPQSRRSLREPRFDAEWTPAGVPAEQRRSDAEAARSVLRSILH